MSHARLRTSMVSFSTVLTRHRPESFGGFLKCHPGGLPEVSALHQAADRRCVPAKIPAAQDAPYAPILVVGAVVTWSRPAYFLRVCVVMGRHQIERVIVMRDGVLESSVIIRGWRRARRRLRRLRVSVFYKSTRPEIRAQGPKNQTETRWLCEL